jgi:hypothetical protein
VRRQCFCHREHKILAGVGRNIQYAFLSEVNDIKTVIDNNCNVVCKNFNEALGFVLPNCITSVFRGYARELYNNLLCGHQRNRPLPAVAGWLDGFDDGQTCCTASRC